MKATGTCCMAVMGCLLAGVLTPSLGVEGMDATARMIFVSPTGTAAGDGTDKKPLDIATAFSTNSPAKPDETIVLQGGTYEGLMKGIERLPFVLQVSGQKEKPIRVMAATGSVVHLNGTLDVTGSHVWVIGLEIGDLQWDMEEKTHKNSRAINIAGCQDVKIINCNIFGGWNGVTAMADSSDIEFYGCIVHDFGNWAHKAPGGSSFYVQNAKGTKSITDCVAYRSAGLNVAPHGQSGSVRGFGITQNIIFLGGAIAPTNNYENLIINTSSVMDEIHVTSNVIYQADATRPWKANIRMSNHRKPVVNQRGSFEYNYVAGAATGLRVGQWEDFRASGNTIWAQRVLVEISSATVGDAIPAQEEKPDLSHYALTDNAYYAAAGARAFLYSNKEKGAEPDHVTFAEWQKLGLDKESKLLPVKDGKPTGTKVFVFPNHYQADRAHVAIFNWDGLNEVEVDLGAGFKKGTRLTVYNLFDVHQTIGQAKPVLSATFDGGKIKFPLRKDPTCPDFDAFLINP